MKKIHFVVGSQLLYGDNVLKSCQKDAETIVTGLNDFLKIQNIAAEIELYPILTDKNKIEAFLAEADRNPECLAVIVWPHTFTPSGMWLNGLKNFKKPLCVFQTNAMLEIPWPEVDMDFMNQNQTSHGILELMHGVRRAGKPVCHISGYWNNSDFLEKVERFIRISIGISELNSMKVAIIGGSPMREVSCTAADPASFQLCFGPQLLYFAVGDLVKIVNETTENEVYTAMGLLSGYDIDPKLGSHETASADLRESLKIYCGLKKFLDQKGCLAFTTNFEDLHGLVQLPGIAVQLLMLQGYGFAAEGNGTTAALVRAGKIMNAGKKGGDTFMEFYIDDPKNDAILGAHMLEICPSIAKEGSIKVQSHPLGIGGKDDPVRITFASITGPAVNIGIINNGNEFELVIADIELIHGRKMPKLPVAQILWRTIPNFETATELWGAVGGPHHTLLSTTSNIREWKLFAKLMDIKIHVIDEHSVIC